MASDQNVRCNVPFLLSLGIDPHLMQTIRSRKFDRNSGACSDLKY